MKVSINKKINFITSDSNRCSSISFIVVIVAISAVVTTVVVGGSCGGWVPQSSFFAGGVHDHSLGLLLDTRSDDHNRVVAGRGLWEVWGGYI